MGEGSSPPPLQAEVVDGMRLMVMEDSEFLVPPEVLCSEDGMQIDKSDCEGPSADADDQSVFVFPIPDGIPDSKLEEFGLQMKSTVGLCYTVTLDRAARTITFSRQPRKLIPGPAMNKDGIVKLTTFTEPFPKERATKLKEAWPEVELILHAKSIACVLDLANCCMHVSTTSSLKDPFIIEKARHLLKLLSTSLVPPYMALEIFRNVRQEKTINIGFQEGGICSNFGIKKDDYLKRWERLFYSLKALSKATCCHIFLDENTFTAVTTAGSSVEGTYQLKAVVKDCIIRNVCPSTYVSMDDPHYKHTECLKFVPVSKKDEMLEVCSLYTLLHEKRVSKLQESLPKLEPFLKKYGISYTLDKNSMVLSTTRGTKNPDIIDKAWQLLELLSTTHVPASMAIEVLDCMQTCLIKIGNQEGGLCSLYGIKEEDYSERWECLRHSLQIVAETVECSVFLNDNTFAAVGESVGMIKHFVKNCILRNVCPGTVARDHNWLSRGLISIEDPHVQHMGMENSWSATTWVRPELTSLYTYFKLEQGTQVKKDWKGVEECLKKHGYCCKLITEGNYCSMIVSGTTNTGDPDITNKIWDFLKLLSVDLEPSTAIDVMNGSMHYDFIPTGSRYGALCSKFGVTEEQYKEVVWPRIESGSESVASYLDCEFIIMPGLTVVCGPRDLRAFRGFVYRCFHLRPPAVMKFWRGGKKGKNLRPIGPVVKCI